MNLHNTELNSGCKDFWDVIMHNCVVHYILEDHVTSTLTADISQVWPAIYRSLATKAMNKLMETNSHDTASVLGGGEA